MTMHMPLKRLVVTLGLFFLMSPGGGMATAHAAEQHVIILIDRSGAMSAVEPDGRTRFQKAISRAQEMILVPSTSTRHYAVWSFEGSTYIKHLDYTTNLDFVMSSLFTMRVGSGMTPLALALCAAVDDLRNYRPAILATKHIALFVGTRENNSPMGTQCAGPSSATPYPSLTPASWQWKVLNMLRTGNPNNASHPGPLSLITNYDSVFSAIENATPAIP